MNRPLDPSSVTRLRQRLGGEPLDFGDEEFVESFTEETTTTADVSDSLDFTMLNQKERNWCWAAVGSSVANYHDDAGWTVCQMVNAILNRSDCCLSSVPNECDEKHKLSPVLKKNGNFLDWDHGKNLDLAMIKSHIAKKRPICFQVKTPKQVHFAAIYGFIPGSPPRMLVADSAKTDFAAPIGSVKKYHKKAELNLLLFTKKK